MRRVALIVIAAGLAVAGCGSSKPKKHAVTGCRAIVANALHSSAGRPAAPQFGIATCSYRLPGGARVTVITDTNPQAFKRFDRAEVETFQNSQWSSTPSLAPRLVNHVGAGADWIPFYRELIAADGRNAAFTITVKGDDAHAEQLAIATAKATLRRESAQ
jgi:hypothetical protein